MNTKGMMTSNSNEWYTPKKLFDKIEKKLGVKFTLDPCATPESAKCEKYYTKEDNGLNKNWKGHNVFINPPYSKDLQPLFIKKAFEESLKENTVCVLLIPLRAETKIWHDYIFKYAKEIYFIKKRIKFETIINGELKQKGTSTFASSIVVFDGKNNITRFGTMEQ